MHVLLKLVENQTACQICYQQIERYRKYKDTNGVVVRKFEITVNCNQCVSVFHDSCIRDSLRINKDCPICKVPMELEETGNIVVKESISEVVARNIIILGIIVIIVVVSMSL